MRWEFYFIDFFFAIVQAANNISFCILQIGMRSVSNEKKKNENWFT